MQGMLYEVRPLDAATFLALPAILILAAFAASAWPAFRATRVSPLIALRTE
jgi:ABC-type antimicrobial peptide transport system permease subunit